MNRIKLATLIVLTGLLIGAGAAQTTQTDRSSTNLQASFINSDPVPLQSGESGDITFKLMNRGDSVAEDVEVELVDNYPFEIKPDRQTSYSLGDLTRGQEYQIHTEVMVADDAPDGSNDFKFRIIHGDTNITRNIPVEVQSRDIELNVANLRTEPRTLMPDTKDAFLSVDVVNNGEKTAENVVMNLDLPEHFERTSSFSTRQALGNVQAGEVKTAEFRFDVEEDAPAGETSITGDITYSADDSTTELKEEVDFNLHISGKPQFRITDVESQLETDSTEELRLTVENRGEEKSSATRVRVLESSDQPFSYSSSNTHVGTLEPGETGQAVFEVETEPEAAIKDYLIDFEIRGVKDTEVFVEDKTTTVNIEDGETGNIPVPITGIILLLLGIAAYILQKKHERPETAKEEEQTEEE